MHISRVLVRNFRNFEELLIDPYPRAAVVVGANGVGKSNLMQALGLVLDPSLPDTARQLRAEDICEYADSSLEEGVEVRVEVDISGFGSDEAASIVFDHCFVKAEPLTARLIYVFRPRSGHGTPGELTADHYEWKIFRGNIDGREAHQIRHDVPLNVLPALRDVVRDLSRWRDSPLQELLKANPPSSAALKAAATAIQEAMDKLVMDGPIKAIARDLGLRLDDLAGPQMSATPTFGFTSGNPDRLLRSTQLFTDIERVRSVADASSGHANVIYLALLLERFAVRRHRDAVLDSLLAVEEPEAHLHPVLQRQLFRALLRGGTSLTVTTHSPNITAVSPLDSLVHLISVPGRGTVARTAARAGLSRTQQADIERYLTVSRVELLFCSAAILVEGPSEAYLLPALARVLGFDLDAHGVIIAEVSGAAFGPYRALLGSGALSVPHVIITDGDPVRRVRGQMEQVHAGLRRAARLMPEEADVVGLPLSEVVESIAAGELPGDLFGARLRAAAEGDVFVGVDTLEVDIVPLLDEDMIEAFGELQTSPTAARSFNMAVRALTGGNGGSEDRDELLRRIEAIGKGRFAQRLAHLVEGLPGPWLAGMIADQDEAISPGHGEDAITMERLMGAGSFGYLSAALDRVSWMVRGRSLLPILNDRVREEDDG